MSEDDTFEALRRVPIIEIIRLWQESPVTFMDDDSTVDNFFNRHGWTRQQFTIEWNKFNGKSWVR